METMQLHRGRLIDHLQLVVGDLPASRRFYGAVFDALMRAGKPHDIRPIGYRALESLRDRNPALVWKSARGEYAVDDAAMHRWFEQRSQARRWPPVDPQGRLAMDDDRA